ncbi:amino acid synthesis family protein [Desulforhopalus singaporensis]|uniref:Amino acid synthesis n=1 Tax=Desulforhopalus singaporensis TaxID=91360 RepID=A0A1H0N6M8_9BACT|nr:amino acid synthesis family protein [Desulforhopalus singaporensis]SDO88389.1 Amino acid synthesis [Desulforhopalus singaporensis]
MKPEVRSVYTILEETHVDGVRALEKPTRKAACAAVFKNPYAGQYVEDLSLLYEFSKELGEMLTQKAVAALGITPDEVQSYGKAAIAGLQGEREHCAALMHPALGKPIRDNVGGGKALLPSAKKLGGPGCAIDLPLGHKDAAYVRSHFDAMEVRIPDAPKDDELVLIVGVTDSGRPFPRVGGLTIDEIKGEDGLR